MVRMHGYESEEYWLDEPNPAGQKGEGTAPEAGHYRCTHSSTKVSAMTRSEEDRDDPSAGKSGASPSAPGSGKKSRTVDVDPDTKIPPDPDSVPQASPVPDVPHALEEDRKAH